MSLMNFVSDKDKKLIEQENNEKIESMRIKLRAEGLTDYQIERKLEELFMQPDKLDKNMADGSGIHLNKIFFIINDEDYVNFKKVFKVLTYQGDNCNQNWLLSGFINLVLVGKIKVDDDKKEVSI